MRPRRSMMLVLVLACLALAAALVAPLGVLAGTQTLLAGYQADGLRHKLAVESAVAVLPEVVAREDRLADELERHGRFRWAFELDGLAVEVLVQDDGAKVPLRACDDPQRLLDVLSALQREAGLPQAELAVRLVADRHGVARAGLVWTGCLDDLFVAPGDAALFGTPVSGATWAGVVSPVGRQVHLMLAPESVLEAAFADLRLGLGRRIAELRKQETDMSGLIRALELPQEQAKLVAERLTTRSERLSVLVRTRLGGDVRQRYVICDRAAPPRVLVDWEVAP